VAGALRQGPLPRVRERTLLTLAPDDRNVEMARDQSVAEDRHQRIRGHRRGLSFQFQQALRAHLDRVAHEPPRHRADQHLARLRRLLVLNRSANGD
jgi:hypothetical protein